MILNYAKIAWRNLIKNKAHSLINILGLSVGLTFSLLIMLWVQHELAMDNFHQNGPQLYQVYEHQYYDHGVHGQYSTPALLANELKKQLPEVMYATNLAWNNWNNFRVGEKKIKLEGNFAGADYFKMFSFPLLHGNAKTALSTPLSICISRKMANAFFGSPDAAIGKTIRYENRKDFKVTAVFEKIPEQSSEKFDFVINGQAFLEDNAWAKDWGTNAFLTYVMLRKDADPKQVEKKIAHFLDNLNKEQKKGVFTVDLNLQRFDQTYLHNNFGNDGKIEGGRIEYVRLFSIVAIFILLIACINFMNLTTARSVKRAREIGVRKVVGANRNSLIAQFIGESLLLTLLSVVVAIALLIVLLPLFNSITLKNLALPFNQSTFWIKLLLITLVTGLISGSYPAMFLSSFKPVKVLKGTLKLDWKTVVFRKGLVVFQFTLSVILIIGTIIVSRQINYIQSKNLGYDRENLIYLSLDGDMAKKYNLFKTEALTMPGIQSVSRINIAPTDIDNGTSGVQWDGKDPNVNIEFTQVSVGYDFTKVMKLKLVQGRDFSKDFATDSVGYILNEAALKRIGYKDPIGKPLTFWGKKGKIIGVFKDFHYTSIHDAIKPLIARFGEKYDGGSALIRTQPGKTKEAIAGIEKLWQQINPDFPFNYNFSDDEYKLLYTNEQVIGKLSNVFAFLAIFISCLGLLGLAMFTAEQRVKEIGIRKVLGASIASLFGLLSGEFLLLVFIALIIASPVAWYAMNKWLDNYAYHAPVQWWMFVLAAIAALTISLLTVSYQSIRAALINPVKSLRSE